MKSSYKDALIEEIVRSPNNVYSFDILKKLKIIYLESILTDLVLSGGKPITKMNDKQLESCEEVEYD